MDYASMVAEARSIGELAESRAISRTKAAAAIDIGASISGGGSSGGLFGGKSNQNLGRTYGALRGWVSICLNAIAKRVAGQSIGAGEITGGSDEKKKDVAEPRPLNVVKYVPHARLPKTLKQNLVVRGEAVEEMLTHPILDALAQPNKVQGKWEFLYCTILNLYCTGQSYWVGGKKKIKVAGGGTIDGVELWAMPTNWIEPVHEGGMFTGYKLRIGGNMEKPAIDLTPEQVCRIYLPDPADPKAAISPILQQSPAVRSDDAIQSSQEDMLNRSIFPNVVITVGKVKGADGQERRPHLSGAQRKQILRAIRQVWDETVNRGDPAIVDGLIESITKLSSSPAEMDYPGSGEIIKKRIFQAFGVNPYVVGDQLPGSRAQSAVAEQNFLDNTVNPLIDNITTALQRFVPPMFESAERLAVWLEVAVPSDDDLKQRRWDSARRANDVSPNEYRSEILGLPPVKTIAAERTGLINSPSTMTQVTSLVGQVGQGMIAPEDGKAILKLFLQLTDAEAGALLKHTKPPEPAPPPGPGDPNAIPAIPGPPGKPPAKPDSGAPAEETEDLPNIDAGKLFTSREVAALLKYNEDQPRDENGRFGSGGGGSTGKMQEMFERISKPDGGFTYQPTTGASPTEGYALSIHPDRSFAKAASEMTFNDLVKFTIDNADLLKESGNHVGAWHDPASGKVFLDVSTVTNDPAEAESLAKQHDQIAYFDLKGGKSVTVNPNATSGGVARVQAILNKAAENGELPLITRGHVKEANRRKVAKLEREVALALVPFSDLSIAKRVLDYLNRTGS